MIESIICRTISLRLQLINNSVIKVIYLILMDSYENVQHERDDDERTASQNLKHSKAYYDDFSFASLDFRLPLIFYLIS